ncbi:MAG: S4 domain-containing protein YaaA, partial [Mycoplasmoidaceae bacterium]|nr:S4 domain-containing protein YaaA [Mycoplasmoidaceae bacterium]
IKIKTDYITLGQLVKFIGLISNGCEAKSFLANNVILYNGEKESRRGKKIYPNDKVVIGNKEYLIEKE